MFNTKTTLILGAGASIPYGYPSGAELIKKIIENIEDDDIYIPTFVNVDTDSFVNDIQQWPTAFKHENLLADPQKDRFSPQNYYLTGKRTKETAVTKIKLNDIEIYKAAGKMSLNVD